MNQPNHCTKELNGAVWDPDCASWRIVEKQAAKECLRSPKFSNGARIEGLFQRALQGSNCTKSYPALRRFTKARLGLLDGAEHKKLRAALQPAFTQKSLAGLRPNLSRIAQKHANACAAHTRFDLLTTYIQPMVQQMLLELLEFPPGCWAKIERWAACQTRFYIGQPDPAAQKQVADAAQAAVLQYEAFFLAQAACRTDDPASPSLLSLLQALPRFASREREAELAAVCLNVLTAGYWPVVSALSTTIPLTLDQGKLHPDTPDENAALIDSALLQATPAQHVARVTTEQVTLASVKIKSGAQCLVSLSALTQDLSGSGPNSAFGLGPHYCLGSRLAQMMMEEAVTALFVACSNLEAEAPLSPSDPRSGLRHIPHFWLQNPQAQTP
ncbi:cytochrome P450 [Yoonia maritima]|uniref:Cytochrome P450 n=1 Tax=Yoonia maritima TaxID=1435347 RepID=A0A2T0VV88_9RHOB|nr:cytochrome P450 [Yoonia maritima]PRY75530.1 cytochrome P450 [Yoonia maritima]